MSSQSRWLNWKPATQKIEKTPESEPTKTTKRVFDVFEGSRVANSQKISAVETQRGPNPVSEPSTLKGQAAELWRDGKRFFVVTDEADAQEAIRRFGARRGEIWTSGELELVARFEDQATRDAVEALKRELDGSLSQDDGSRGVSPEESKATALNKLFDEQGIGGRGRNKANIRHGLERRAEGKR